MRKLAITYANDDTRTKATRAIFQGAASYNALGNNPNCLISSIGGYIFRYTITNNRCYVQNLTPSGEQNNPTLEQAWLAQGQDFLVINDGEARPFVFDGAQVKRLPEGTYLPPGRQIHYVNGRFIVALPAVPEGPSSSYIASDLVYNTGSGTPAYDYRDSILHTTDNAAILAGAAFAVPLSAGPITALFSVAIPDTSLGQGPLQVATLGGIFSVNLPLDATLWTTTEQPSQTVSLPNGGVTGAYAVTTVNGDAWYRSPDGLRSFITARRDFNTWVQTPLSFELARVLPFDTQALLGHASAVNFNNRLLCTCSPYRVEERGIAHRGLVSLDFNNISSITQRSQPAYDGLWVGQPILQIVKGRFNGVERCFAFCLDGAGDITLYEIGYDDTARFDWDGSSNVPMQCWLESPAMLGREGDPRSVAFKRLLSADLWLSDLSGTDAGNVTFTTSFLSDYLPCWEDWNEFTLCALACPDQPSCSQPVAVQPQYATYLRLPQPPDVCNSVTLRPSRSGYFFQFKLAWTGHACLRALAMWASVQPETFESRTCTTSPTCRALQCCEDDLFAYHIEEPADPCQLSITSQPESQTIDEGSTLNLSVSVTGGEGTVTYQWYLDGIALVNGASGDATISGANSADLSIENISTDLSGDYTVVAIDQGVQDCSVTSSAAAVTVTSAPSSNQISLAFWINMTTQPDLADTGVINRYAYELWDDPDGDRQARIFLSMTAAGSGSSNYKFSLTVEQGEDSNSFTNEIVSLPIRTWHHIAIVYDGNTGYASLYVDASIVATTGGTPVVLNSQPYGLIDLFNDGYNIPDYTDGYVFLQDMTGLWIGHALTNPELTLLYNSGAGLNGPPWTTVTAPTVWWDFDDADFLTGVDPFIDSQLGVGLYPDSSTPQIEGLIDYAVVKTNVNRQLATDVLASLAYTA